MRRNSNDEALFYDFLIKTINDSFIEHRYNIDYAEVKEKANHILYMIEDRKRLICTDDGNDEDKKDFTFKTSDIKVDGIPITDIPEWMKREVTDEEFEEWMCGRDSDSDDGEDSLSELYDYMVGLHEGKEMADTEVNPTKAQLITMYMIHKEVSLLSIVKWNKLMFFIDGFYMTWYDTGRQITDLSYIKLPYGPVPDQYNSILSDMEDLGYIAITQKNSMYDTSKLLKKGPKMLIDFSGLAIDEKAAVDFVLEAFSFLGERDLSNFSKSLDAWAHSKLYDKIYISLLFNDSFLKAKYGECNFAKAILRIRDITKDN